MARYRDDDDRDDDRRDRDDDRPRRARRDRDDDPPKKSNTGMVLLIVGLAVGIPLLICGGLGVWGVFWVRGKADEVAGTYQSHLAAENFLDTLQRNSIDSAYTAYTTPGFRNGMSKEQFEKLVKANPVLLTTNSHIQNGYPSPTGTTPNRKLVLIYTVSSFGGGSGIDDPEFPDDMNPPPKPGGVPPKPGGVKPPKPIPPKGTTTSPTITCTVTVAEQADKTWKVDGFTVP